MEIKKISKKLMKRLPLYLEYIKSLPDSAVYISSAKIAAALGLGAVMVRKDLAKVSDGGRCKLGYIRTALIRDIEVFLEVTSTRRAILIGAGNLDRVITDCAGILQQGIHILAGFDMDPAPETTCGEIPIYAMNKLFSFCQAYNVSVGIITIPGEDAQRICNRLIACDVDTIWNLSNAHLTVPDHVCLRTDSPAGPLTPLLVHPKAEAAQRTA